MFDTLSAPPWLLLPQLLDGHRMASSLSTCHMLSFALENLPLPRQWPPPKSRPRSSSPAEPSALPRRGNKQATPATQCKVRAIFHFLVARVPLR